MADAACAEEPTASAFWNINIPPSMHTTQCPDYLQYAITNEKDRGILSTLDGDFHRQTWAEVQQHIHRNRLDLLQRVPSDLRRYREYCARIVRDYGSIMAFVMRERLRWTDLRATQPPFRNPDDYKILYNDWPYGVDERIVHLVIWTKFDLASDPATDDLTPESRRAIEGFVDRIFVRRCGWERVIWFKNWASLKSIRAVEHFHVMLFDPPMEFVDEITGGDIPLAVKVAKSGAMEA